MNFLILIFIITCLVFEVSANKYPLFMYSSNNKIYSSRLELNNTFKLYNITVFNENDGSFAMDYSINQNVIIYKSYKKLNLYISYIGLKSSEEKQFSSVDLYAHNIAIDWIHNLIYFGYLKDIHVMNILNKRMRAIIAKNEKFIGIVVNPLESFIVWTQKEPNPAIIRANQDGSNRTVLVDKDLYKPVSIVIDFETNAIYFMDSSYFYWNLFSIDFSGNDRKLMHQFNKSNSFLEIIPLDIYNQNFYIYDEISSEFIKMNSEGIIIDKFKIKDNSKLVSIKIIDSSRQLNGQNKCIGSYCTHLCLPNTYNQFICKCPEKEYLLPGEICESVRHYIRQTAITSPAN